MSRPDRDDSNGPRSSPAVTAGTTSEAVDLEEAADGLSHLLMALLADDQPVVRMGAERLVLGSEPGREPLGRRLGHDAIQPAADHEPGDLRVDPRIDGDAREDRSSSPTALVRFLAEQVLDSENVG